MNSIKIPPAGVKEKPDTSAPGNRHALDLIDKTLSVRSNQTPQNPCLIFHLVLWFLVLGGIQVDLFHFFSPSHGEFSGVPSFVGFLIAIVSFWHLCG